MQKLFVIILASLILGGCNLKSFFTPAPAGLEIATIPAATVSLNAVDSGTTPYSNQAIKAGTYLLKLTPNSPDLSPYETKLDLASGTSTVISHTFAPTLVDSAGYSLQLVEGLSDDTHLSIISDPDRVNVNLDGTPYGFTPLSKLAITPGAHTISISSPGFTSQDLSVTTRKGYNLIVNVKLAGSSIILSPPSPTPSASATSSASPTPSLSPSSTPPPITLAKPYVTIGETETGWLRIRQDASSTSAELGKANTGEKLKYLGVTTETGWHKIEFEGNPGYISAKYSTLVK